METISLCTSGEARTTPSSDSTYIVSRRKDVILRCDKSLGTSELESLISTQESSLFSGEDQAGPQCQSNGETPNKLRQARSGSKLLSIPEIPGSLDGHGSGAGVIE